MISAKEVQRLRQETGAGMMDCKRALEQAGGDYGKAKVILRELGFERAQRNADRVAAQGLVVAYVHANGRFGVLVELNSETDFVARSPEFRELAREIAMQVGAMAPESVEDLLTQPYIRDGSKTVQDLVTALAAKVGENIKVHRFARYELGGA